MSEGIAQSEPLIPAPQQELIQIDKQKQQRITKYLQTRRRTSSLLSSLTMLFFIFYIIPTWYSTIAAIIGNSRFAIQPLTNWYPLRLAIIYLYIAGVLSTLFFPFSFFNGFLFPKIYKIRSRNFLVWLISWLAVIVLITGRWLAFFELCYWLIIVQPNSWWIWVTLILSLISIGRSYIWPTFFFSHQYRCTEITDGHMIQMLNELTERSPRKTGVRRLVKIERKTRNKVNRKELLPNGYLAGWGRTRSIILTDGLLNNFTPAETRSILAHELGHHAHHDISKKTALNLFLLAGELYAWNQFYHWSLGLWNSPDTWLGQGYFWLLLLFGVRFGIYLFKRAYSRYREHRADEFALQLTGDVFAFKNAMLRLMDRNSNPFILSPSLELEQSHPSTQRRLRHADRFAAKMAQAYQTGKVQIKAE